MVIKPQSKDSNVTFVIKYLLKGKVLATRNFGFFMQKESKPTLSYQ